MAATVLRIATDAVGLPCSRSFLGVWRMVSECPGSCGVPVEPSRVLDDDGSASGEYPRRGERMLLLGYADLLPGHKPPSTAA